MRTKCYCEGELESIRDRLHQCQDCERYWLQSKADDELYLAVPWKGFGSHRRQLVESLTKRRGEQISSHWNCPRCGFLAAFDGDRHRVTCSNCDYSYFAASEGIPPISHKLANAYKSLVKKLAEADDPSQDEAIITRLRAIKTETEGLKEEIL